MSSPVLKSLSVTFLFSACIFFKGASQPTCPVNNQNRVLLIGDSWTHIMWNNRTYKDVFDQFGFADKLERGTNTAIGGTTASYWVLPGNLAVIVNELQNNPSIDIVLLSIGGNDFLAGINGAIPGWHTGLNATDESLLLDRIQADIQTIIDAIKSVRPNIEIVFSGYDYINLVETVINDQTGSTILLWANLGQPSALQVNTAFSHLEQRKINIANADPRVHYVHAMGLMQNIYGYPGIFAPNSVPFPGQLPSSYAPFPGGDVNYPTPPVALGANGADAIHLSDNGYRHLVVNQTVSYFHNKFRGGPNATFVSQGGSNDGWIRSDGNFGTGTIRMGDMSSGNTYRGIVSCNTDAIPDNATITGASLFINRSSLSGFNPFTGGFLGTPIVDVKQGSFGAANIEITDYFAGADATDAGCFIGTATSNGYTIRIDLKPSGLNHINKTGLTQFRVYFPNANGSFNDYIDFNNGNQPGLLAPFLDIFYSVPPPPATAVVSGDTTICPGENTSLQVTLSGTAPWSVTWSDGLTENNILSSLYSRVVAPSSTTAYTIVSLSDANGPGTSATGNANVEVRLIPSVTVNGLRSNYCVNSPVSNLTASPPGGLWSGPGLTGNTFNPALAVATMGGGQITLTYSGIYNSCQFQEGYAVIVDTASCNQTGSCSFAPVTGYISCAGAGPVTKTYSSSGRLWVFQDLIPGKIYSTSTCDSCGYDSHLMVRDEADSSFIAENDDDCSLQSSVTFVAPASGKVGINLTGERTFQCNPYTCNPHNCNPYDCNPHNCNPYSCNCQTCYQTCYQDQTVYMTCYPGGIQVINGLLTSDCIGACTGGFCWRVQYQVPYNCNPYTCNCQTCYSTCYDTCYQTCYDTCYQTCSDKCGTDNLIPCNVQLQCLNCGIPSATISTVNTNICLGDSVSFTASVAGLTCNTQLLWSFGTDATPATSDSIHPIKVTWATAGIKQVTLQVIEPRAGSSSSQVSVSVNSAPSGGVLHAVAEACVGDTVSFFMDSVLNATGYYWQSTEVLFGSGAIREMVVPDSVVHISVIPFNGACTRDTFYHSVQPKLSPQVNISANGDTSLCPGETVLLYTSASQTLSLQWQLNEQDIIGQQDSTYSVSSAGGYRVRVADTSGCFSFSNEIEVIYFPAPTGVLSGNQNPCIGDTVILLAAYANTSSYQWLLNGATITGAMDTSIIILQDGTYSLIASNNFCTDTASSLNIDFHSPPIANAGADIFVCEGDSVTITATEGNFYQWNTGQLSSSIAFVALTTEDYIVEVSDSFSCADSDTMRVNVYQNPVSPSLSVGSNTLSSIATYSSYQWYLNGTPITGANNQSLVITTSGNYQLEVTDSNGCSATSSIIYLEWLGITEDVNSDALRVYPNPLDFGFWILECGSSRIRSMIEIFDLEGRLVYQSKIRNQKSEIGFNAQSGIYMLRVSSGNQTATIKLVKL